MRVLTGLVPLAALCIAVPASAGFSASQNYGRAPSPSSPLFVGSSENVPQPRSQDVDGAMVDPTIGFDLAETRERIGDARKSGLISRREARQLRREAEVIATHAEIYGRDGFSDSERNELHARTLYLQGLATAPNRPKQ